MKAALLLLVVFYCASVIAQASPQSRCTWDTNHGFYTFSKAGSYTWQTPKRVTYLCIQAWGAGGASSANDNWSAYGGGGAGAQCSFGTVAVTPGQTCNFVIGQGGTVGPNTNGTATYFTCGDTSFVVNAGSGGYNMTAMNGVISANSGVGGVMLPGADFCFTGGAGSTNGGASALSSLYSLYNNFKAGAGGAKENGNGADGGVYITWLLTPDS